MQPSHVLARSAADATIVRIAANQHGLVSRRQLLRAGLSGDVIDRRARSAWLRPVRRGVYAVGPVVSPRATEIAAVLACGEGSVLSYRSASGLWELLETGAGAVEVTVAGGRGGRLRGSACTGRARSTPVT